MNQLDFIYKMNEICTPQVKPKLFLLTRTLTHNGTMCHNFSFECFTLDYAAFSSSWLFITFLYFQLLSVHSKWMNDNKRNADRKSLFCQVSDKKSTTERKQMRWETFGVSVHRIDGSFGWNEIMINSPHEKGRRNGKHLIRLKAKLLRSIRYDSCAWIMKSKMFFCFQLLTCRRLNGFIHFFSITADRSCVSWRMGATRLRINWMQSTLRYFIEADIVSINWN